MRSSQESLATALAPSLRLPFCYLFAALAAFLVLNLLFVIERGGFSSSFFRQGQVMALAHLAALGWITMTAMGAMFQLIPVVLEVPLWSERLGQVQFWVYLVGVLGFVGSLWSLRFTWAPLFAFVLFLALSQFLLNLGMTLVGVRRWDWTGYHIVAALLYLAATAFLGLLLALNLGTGFLGPQVLGFLKGHVYLAVWGWVSLLIVGVSYKLLPMFALSHGYSEGAGKASFVVGNLGVLGLFFGFILGDGEGIWLLASSLLLFLAILLYAVQTYLILKSRRRKLDVALYHSGAAILYLLAAAVLGILSSLGLLPTGFQFYYTYAYLGLMGWISLFIVGQMYKIVPFLAWFHKYSHKVGLEPVPLMKDMFDERLAMAQFYLMNLGILGTSLAFLVNNGRAVGVFGFLVLLGAVIFIYNMVTAYRR
ncbi:MAG: hypothetical protein HY998_04305 [candidate division NC10 bacterium]|nr:hypothetical protein [candidate division NC10 bacterium]